MDTTKRSLLDKQTQVVIFASSAIALYGYDQGMMSLVNTNYNYLQTMGISATSPLVGLIVSVYYLGCAVGSVFFSALADGLGRKRSIFACLAAASAGNFLMFIAGLVYKREALLVMFLGRVIMGMGVGGIDSVVPIYSSELSEAETRGKALGQEFQMNIFGLNMAFGINLGITITLGKYNQWAWRVPIIVMQIFPIALMAVIELLPESPRYFVLQGEHDKAAAALDAIYPAGSKAPGSDLSADDNKRRLNELIAIHEEETPVSYLDMITPGHPQFHATIMTFMVQFNQALTGYGCVSVYGPQIFELLGFTVRAAEFITQANYLSYLGLMTFAWLLIDTVGRRSLMITTSAGLATCFVILGICAGLSEHSYELSIPNMAPAAPGVLALFVATGNFGIGWLATVWLIPTEIFPTTARARGTAVSVIVWGFSNFAVTLFSPIIFNRMSYWIFVIFAGTNTFAGWWTGVYQPETAGRSFEENQRFFEEAAKEGTWVVSHVKEGEWTKVPRKKALADDEEEGAFSADRETGEREALLRRA